MTKQPCRWPVPPRTMNSQGGFWENGADPELLGGRALHELWWAFPHYGKNDPDVAKELVEKVRSRHGGKLPAGDKSDH